MPRSLKKIEKKVIALQPKTRGAALSVAASEVAISAKLSFEKRCGAGGATEGNPHRARAQGLPRNQEDGGDRSKGKGGRPPLEREEKKKSNCCGPEGAVTHEGEKNNNEKHGEK